MKSGIYRIISPSGGFYIGSAVDFGGRRRVHFHLLRTGKHHNQGLQRACNKYGIERLKFEPIIVCRIEDLLFFEQRAIDLLKPRYNACPIAGSQLGRMHSEASIKKMSESRIGKAVHSPEHRKRLSDRMKGNRFNVGKQLPLETREKVSTALKGRRHADGFEVSVTDEQKAEIIRAYLSGIGQNTLALRWGACRRAIRRILVANGIQIIPSGHSAKLQNGN